MTDNPAEPASATPPSTREPAAAEDPLNSTPASPTSGDGTSGLPRGLIIILGLAAAVVVAAGIHQVPGILAPIFLAVVLTVTVNPIRGRMIRHGSPRWLASLTLVIVIFAILLGLIFGLVIGVAQLVSCAGDSLQ
jgi:hypothetical protein